jgi:5'-nucleotidase
MSEILDWMQTWSGGRFVPLAPSAKDIEPWDIAHALSLLCRYGGHVDRFYSVAEHCVLMSQAVAPENALAALLHDATEAYIVDVPRPLKNSLPGYRQIEAMVWLAIAERFGLSPVLPDEVDEADNRIILTERNALMSRSTRPWFQDAHFEPLPVRIEGWPPEEAERRYASRLAALTWRNR